MNRIKYIIIYLISLIIIIIGIIYINNDYIELPLKTDYVKPPQTTYYCKYCNKPSCSNDALNTSKVGTLNMQQCFENKYYKCNPFNGDYSQCTNNYIPLPDVGNCQCNNRTFEMCPYKISEYDYNEKLYKCINPIKKDRLDDNEVCDSNISASIDSSYSNANIKSYGCDKLRINNWNYIDKQNEFLIQ